VIGWRKGEWEGGGEGVGGVSCEEEVEWEVWGGRRGSGRYGVSDLGIWGVGVWG